VIPVPVGFFRRAGQFSPVHLGTFQTPHSGFSPYGAGPFENSITTLNNSFLVVPMWCTQSGTNTAAWDTDLAISGGGLTWTRRVNQRAVSGDNIGGMQIWTAPVGSGATFNIVADDGANSVYTYKLAVYSYTGHDSVSPVGAIAAGSEDPIAGAVAITLGAAPAASSDILAAVGCFSGDISIGAGSGWSELAQPVNIPDSFVDWQIQRRGGSTSTGVDWAEATSSFGGPGHAVAIEIKAAA
jgi:hypothetical protein